MTTDTAHGLTVTEVARRYRVGADKVRGWVQRGELKAINTSTTLCGRPRYVITAESLAAFEAVRTVGTRPKPKRRRKVTAIDFYPD